LNKFSVTCLKALDIHQSNTTDWDDPVFIIAMPRPIIKRKSMSTKPTADKSVKTSKSQIKVQDIRPKKMSKAARQSETRSFPAFNRTA